MFNHLDSLIVITRNGWAPWIQQRFLWPGNILDLVLKTCTPELAAPSAKQFQYNYNTGHTVFIQSVYSQSSARWWKLSSTLKFIKPQLLTNNLLNGYQFEFGHSALDNLETTSWLMMIHYAWSIMEYSPLTWMSNSSTHKQLNVGQCSPLNDTPSAIPSIHFFHHWYTMAVLSWPMMIHKAHAWNMYWLYCVPSLRFLAMASLPQRFPNSQRKKMAVDVWERNHACLNHTSFWLAEIGYPG